jgi:hypothetical protein
MAWKEILVKKYVVRLRDNEREQLAALIRKGSSPAHRLLKARILLKADVSEAGEGWSDNQIINALATSASMVYRVRKQLVEEGFEAVLSRKPRAAPALDEGNASSRSASRQNPMKAMPCGLTRFVITGTTAPLVRSSSPT